MNPDSKDSIDNNDIKNSLLIKDIPNNSTTHNNSIRRPVKKVLLLGFSNVGKSALANKFVFDYFPENNHNSSIEENFKKTIKFKKETIDLVIVDSASLDDFSIIIPQKYSFGINGYIFLYSVDNRSSFERIKKMKIQLNALNGRDLPSVLIANKSDIMMTQRKVKYEEGENFATRHNMPFMEVSVKNDSTEKIEKAFKMIVAEIFREENPNSLGFCDKFSLKRLKEKQKKIIMTIFQYLNILSILLGLFFVLFGAINTVLIPSFIMKNGVILFVVLADGLLIMLISIFGFFGVKYDNLEYLKIVLVLTPVEFIVEILGLLLIKTTKDGDTDAEKYIEKFEPLILGFLIFAIVFKAIMLVFTILTKNFVTSKKKTQTRNRRARPPNP